MGKGEGTGQRRALRRELMRVDDRAFDIIVLIFFEQRKTVDLCHIVGNDIESGRVAESGSSHHIETFIFVRWRGKEHFAHTQRVEPMPHFDHIHLVSSLPAGDDDCPLAHSQADDNTLSPPLFDCVADEERLFHRTGTQYYPRNTQFKGEAEAFLRL